VSRLPATIPRACDDQGFFAEPLDFLAATRARMGDMFVLREAAPLFSRSPNCAGVVVAFGAERHRAVLGDIDSFGMPVSAAHHLTLPANLANLNRGLHSMRGQEHASRRRILSGILSASELGRHHALLRQALERGIARWQAERAMGLLQAMRALAEQLSSCLLFGERHAANEELLACLKDYFLLRREASSPASSLAIPPAKLLAAGNALDSSLRSHVRHHRRIPASEGTGIFGKLAAVGLESGEQMSEDEIVAHCNVSYISSTEPVAVSLTWILLILTQLPVLQRELRREIRSASSAPGAVATAFDRRSLLDRVINEALRLFPPNAFMVRTTTRPTSLDDIRLPEDCEVVLCPLLAHRDAASFADPGTFLPSRWERASPTPFEYFPFGAGGHSCVGRALAVPLLKLVLAFLLDRFDFTLAGDQAIDWRLHILFLPRNDPSVLARPAEAVPAPAGTLAGPVARLVDFSDSRLTPLYI
jgi:cytochrome P450